MNQGIRLVVYPVKDVARAKILYSKFLGAEPYPNRPPHDNHHEALESALHEIHPYEVPEIIAVPVVEGSKLIP